MLRNRKDTNPHQAMIDEWEASGKTKVVEVLNNNDKWEKVNYPSWSKHLEYRFQSVIKSKSPSNSMKREEKKKAGRKSKFPSNVKTVTLYNQEVPEKEAQKIKDFIKKCCEPYLRESATNTKN